MTKERFAEIEKIVLDDLDGDAEWRELEAALSRGAEAEAKLAKVEAWIEENRTHDWGSIAGKEIEKAMREVVPRGA